MSPRVRILALIGTTVLLASCGLFGGNDDDKELQPMELTDIETKTPIKRLWSTKIGSDSEFLRVALRPVGDGNRIYAASRDGNVVALNPESGRVIWKARLGIDLSAGPGVGGDAIAVVSTDGFLITLDSDSGAERWRTYIEGESLARPLLRNEFVVVQTVDNRLRAYSAIDGNERWTIEQSTPPLTLRGSASPVSVGTVVVTGFDNGRITAVELSTGVVQWEALLSPPTGRSDLDRLSDVDGNIAVVGQDIYAAGYQGRIASLAAASGQVIWGREISSNVGVTADWNNIYTVQEGGEILAMSRRTGAEVWRQGSLLRRALTVPVAFDQTVAVADFEGYIHFFSNVDGAPVARVRAGKAAISTEPVVVANRLYVQSDTGEIAAYVVREERRSRRRAPDTADNEEEGAGS